MVREPVEARVTANYKRSSQARARKKSSLPSTILNFRLRLGAIIGLMAFPACSPTEVRGTYDVEIEIAGVATNLNGTLILDAGFLDIPPMVDDERARFSDWFVSDTLDANSCFILEAPSQDGERSRIVRVFESQFQGGEILLPIESIEHPRSVSRSSTSNFSPIRPVVRSSFSTGKSGVKVVLAALDPGRLTHSGARTNLRIFARICVLRFRTSNTWLWPESFSPCGRIQRSFVAIDSDRPAS